MTEQEKAADNESGAREIRGKLVTRLAVAGALVALLLGVLAFFDYLSTATDESDGQVFTKPVPVVPKKEVSQPVTPAANLPEPPIPATPEKTEAPVESSPPPGIEANTPSVGETRPEVVLANRQKLPATIANPKSPISHPPAPLVQPSPPPEAVAPPSSLPPPQRAPVAVDQPPAKASARLLEATPAPAVASRLFSGFLLQAGVFSSVQRAEELHARLTLSGVPSSLETRVQVGPFKSKHEAEAAQVKLRELGVETILVPPKGKN